MRTRGEYSYDAETQTIRSNDFKRSTMMGDYRGVIVASFSEATGSRPHSYQERDANVSLFMAALDTAHALDEMGFDGEKAIRELPEIFKVLVRHGLLDKIRGEHEPA